jgi:hypothetical protein
MSGCNFFGKLYEPDTPDGRLILVICEQIDESTVYPVMAYEIEE